MLKKTLLSLSLLAAAAAQAQTTPAPALPAAPSTASSPAKKELVTRILRVQQSAIESLARSLAERPAIEIMASAMQVVAQRVPKEKQEATAKDIEAEARKYADSAVPIVQQRAVALAPTTMGAMLEEKFSEDELRQIAAALENPAIVKFQRSLPDLQQSIGERLIAETRGQIEPKVKALEDAVSKKLGLPPAAASGAPAAPQGGAKPPAKKQ
jgi:uncharacterized protein